MKHILKRTSQFVSSMVVMACLAIVGLASTPKAQAQVTPTTFGRFTGTPLTIATNDVVSTNSAAIEIPHGRALAILPEFKLINSGTGNVIFGAQVSADGTNYTTLSGLTYTIAATGTTLARGYWLLDPTELAAVRYLRLSSHNNAANAVVLTNLVVSYSYQNR